MDTEDMTAEEIAKGMRFFRPRAKQDTLFQVEIYMKSRKRFSFFDKLDAMLSTCRFVWRTMSVNVL